MKRIFLIIIIILITSLNIGDVEKVSNTTKSYSYSFTGKKKDISKDEIIASATYTAPHTTKKIIYISKQQFLNKLAFLESSGNYEIANRYNYVGKYQFGKQALKDIGYEDPKIDSIVNSVHKDNNKYVFDTTTFTIEEQEKAVRKLMYRIENLYLKNYIQKYVGKDIGGIRITKAGILASAHLRGSGSIKKYLNSSGTINESDAFGTTVKDYLKKFENYKIDGSF